MAKVKIKVEDEKAWEGVDQDSGDRSEPPKGYYVALCNEVNPGYSKTDGEEDPKKPRLEVVFELQSAWKSKTEVPLTEAYWPQREYVSFSKDSAWKRAEMLWAFSLTDDKNVSEVDIDTDEDMVGKRVLLRIKHEKDDMKSEEEGKYVARARIAKMLRLTDADAENAFGGGDGGSEEVEFGGGSEEASPFGAAEETAEEAVEYYTRAGLEEVEDMKALGEVAKEFDIDPNDHLVKFTKPAAKKGKVDIDATKTAVIDAILEAQGVGDNGGEDAPADEPGGDDESPF